MNQSTKNTKTKSTLKWQSEGQTRAKAKFRAANSHSEEWPTLHITLDNPECPSYQRLVEEQKAARHEFCARYAHALVYDKEMPAEEDHPSPDWCHDCDECRDIPNEGWKLGSYWWVSGLTHIEIKKLREERKADDKPFDKLAEYGKKWGQTEPYPKLPENIWVFGTRKEAQAKAEELAKGLDAQIEAWFAPIVAAKKAKEDARAAEVKAKTDATMAKLNKNREFMARLKELVPGLEGSGQWEGVHINNPEKLLEALS